MKLQMACSPPRGPGVYGSGFLRCLAERIASGSFPTELFSFNHVSDSGHQKGTLGTYWTPASDCLKKNSNVLFLF